MSDLYLNAVVRLIDSAFSPPCGSPRDSEPDGQHLSPVANSPGDGGEITPDSRHWTLYRDEETGDAA